MERIIVCDCKDMPSFARDAYKLLFKGSPVPPITQTDNFSEFGEWAQYLTAALKAGAKYAYAIHDGELWDLLRGLRVA